MLDAGDGIEPSFFEVATAAAFLAFARTPADACILEVGLGGRLDATNVVERPLVTGIANLALDHQQFLGDATDRHRRPRKPGSPSAGVPLVTQLYPPAVGQPDRRGRAAAGRAWLPRGGAWDAIVRQGALHYRDRARRARPAAAAAARPRTRR